MQHRHAARLRNTSKPIVCLWCCAVSESGRAASCEELLVAGSFKGGPAGMAMKRVLDVELVAAVVVIDVTGNWLVELMEKWTGRLVNDIGIIATSTISSSFAGLSAERSVDPCSKLRSWARLTCLAIDCSVVPSGRIRTQLAWQEVRPKGIRLTSASSPSRFRKYRGETPPKVDARSAA